MSAFTETSRIFENTKLVRCITHDLESAVMERFTQSCAALFHGLDRSDPSQADLSRRLWVLRSTTLFTLLPFNAQALALQEQLRGIQRAFFGLPELVSALDSLQLALGEIVVSANPKRDWFLRFIGEEQTATEELTGLFCALSPGRPPGWPPEAIEHIRSCSQRIAIIDSRKALESQRWQRIVLPCACRNTATRLLSDLFHSGCTSHIDVLLYPSEHLHVPQRLRLPQDGIFDSRVQTPAIEQQKRDVLDDSPMTVMDAWVEEAFWQGVHGGSRTQQVDHVLAHYVLFSDGTGTFISSNGSIAALPVDGLLSDANDLRLVKVQDLEEGDLVVMRSGGSAFLLDETTDRIMSNSGTADLLERATDWKAALEALMITESSEEIAHDLRDRQVNATSLNVQKWAGPDVLGPGDQRVFFELIGLLAKKNKLSLAGESAIAYAEIRWAYLQELRGVRMRAGSMIRQNLFAELAGHLGHVSQPLADRTSIHIEGNLGVELLVLRLACVDSTPCYVNPSRINRIDDLGGNRWLG